LFEALRYKPVVAGSIPECHWNFSFASASNRNEYQDYFLGAKAAGA